MKKSILFVLLLLLINSLAFSQKVYFIYLQTEGQQPFYLRMDEKVYNSTSAGYLILPKLKDSTYSFSIGFPGNKWPEQKYSIPVKSKDHGFLLKDFGEKGWGLFDLQTLNVLMGTQAKTSTGIKTEPREVSAFTAILAKAADDPSLRDRPVFAVAVEEKPVPVQAVAKEEAKTPAVSEEVIAKQEKVVEKPRPEEKVAIDTKTNSTANTATVEVKEQQKEDSSVKSQPEAKAPPVVKPEEIKSTEVAVNQESQVQAKKEEPVTQEIKEDKVEQKPVATESQETKEATAYKRSQVTKWSESSTSEGFGLTFYDEYDGRRDTIRIIIPNSKKSLAGSKEAVREERKFLDISEGDTSNKNLEPVQEDRSSKTKKKPLEACSAATENDFMKLRRKMAAGDSDDEMIDEARKVFKSKCFSVVQVKNLAVLFLNDNGRYNFFQVAKAYVSDKENFASLSSELKDEAYITRFRAMVE